MTKKNLKDSRMVWVVERKRNILTGWCVLECFAIREDATYYKQHSREAASVDDKYRIRKYVPEEG